MTNKQPKGNNKYCHIRGGGGYSSSNSDGDKGDETPVLEVPSTLSTTQDSSHGRRCGGGGSVGREAGGAGRSSSAYGWPNVMSDVVRF